MTDVDPGVQVEREMSVEELGVPARGRDGDEAHRPTSLTGLTPCPVAEAPDP